MFLPTPSSFLSSLKAISSTSSKQKSTSSEQKSTSSEQKSTSSKQKTTSSEQKSTSSKQKTIPSFVSKNFFKIKSRKRFTKSKKQESTSEQNTTSSSAFKNLFKIKSRKRFNNSKKQEKKESTSEQNTTSSTASKNFPSTKFIPVKSRKRFTKYVAFGDSFSDNGNSYNLTNETWPTPINYKGHFTNGKVWTEYLAELLNVKLTNYAFGGATSNSDFVQGLTGPQTEFKVWDTGNDYFFSDMKVPPLDVVKSLMDALRFLVESLPTIKTILVPNMHDLSQIPAYKTSNTEEKKRISEMIKSYNKSLLEHLVKFSRETNVRIIYLKIDKFFKELQTEDGMACYGIINGKDEANDLYKNSDSNTNNDEINNEEKDLFFFWDAYHVTTKVHEALANVYFEIIENLNSPILTRKRNSFATKTLGVTLGDYTQ
ncbi:20524_t:CDS:2 [Cetraspora pellucida]|uniref:20524_t:CDS:1 n=1 Tax=Cetraspora pellucida TaxID=1433469 RepID=A0A9N9BY27_9GLOM|nr:20524_t:CDS:2 [Cetraspora pellucida]